MGWAGTKGLHRQEAIAAFNRVRRDAKSAAERRAVSWFQELFGETGSVLHVNRDHLQVSGRPTTRGTLTPREYADHPFSTAEFARGFLRQVWCDFRAWAKHARELIQSNTIECVLFATPPPAIVESYDDASGQFMVSIAPESKLKLPRIDLRQYSEGLAVQMARGDTLPCPACAYAACCWPGVEFHRNIFVQSAPYLQMRRPPVPVPLVNLQRTFQTTVPARGETAIATNFDGRRVLEARIASDTEVVILAGDKQALSTLMNVPANGTRTWRRADDPPIFPARVTRLVFQCRGAVGGTVRVRLGMAAFHPTRV